MAGCEGVKTAEAWIGLKESGIKCKCVKSSLQQGCVHPLDHPLDFPTWTWSSVQNAKAKASSSCPPPDSPPASHASTQPLRLVFITPLLKSGYLNHMTRWPSVHLGGKDSTVACICLAQVEQGKGL